MLGCRRGFQRRCGVGRGGQSGMPSPSGRSRGHQPEAVSEPAAAEAHDHGQNQTPDGRIPHGPCTCVSDCVGSSQPEARGSAAQTVHLGPAPVLPSSVRSRAPDPIQRVRRTCIVLRRRSPCPSTRTSTVRSFRRTGFSPSDGRSPSSMTPQRPAGRRGTGIRLPPPCRATTLRCGQDAQRVVRWFFNVRPDPSRVRTSPSAARGIRRADPATPNARPLPGLVTRAA